MVRGNINFKIYLKYKDTENKKLREFVDMDLSPHGEELKKIGKHEEDYRKFEI